jgi:hypothetical protein
LNRTEATWSAAYWAAEDTRAKLASAAVVGATPVARRTRLPSSNSHRSMTAPA